MKDRDSRKIPKGLKGQVRAGSEHVVDLLGLHALDAERNLQVIIETPRGSRNKYAYDDGTGLFECEFALPLGMAFPFDFGFVPSSLAEDGDPIDVLVFMDEPCFPGCTVRTRLIGALEAKQTDVDGTIFRNDRLLAVQPGSLQYSHIKEVSQLPHHVLDQLEHFFVAYNEPRGKHFQPLSWCSAFHAYRLLDTAVKNYSERGRAA